MTGKRTYLQWLHRAASFVVLTLLVATVEHSQLRLTTPAGYTTGQPWAHQ